MKFTPRAEEIAEIVELLEDDGYDSAESLAKDIIKRVVDFLWFRQWFVIAQRNAPWWGPFASEDEARSMAAKVPLVMGEPGYIVKVYGLGRTATERPGGGFGYCVSCSHPEWAHSMAERSRGKCLLPDCGCEKYEAKKKPRPSRAKKATS